MKHKLFLILSSLITVIAAGTGCSPSAGTPDYKVVTIKELVQVPNNLDGQRVIVSGQYISLLPRPLPACIPIGTGENPEIKEKYVLYDACSWGISNPDGTIGVVVIDNGVHNSTLPNYQEGQVIELKGMVKNTTVRDYCNMDVRYRSAYLEVNQSDIDITTKTFPSP